MSEPAIFGLIRDGETRYYADRWAVVFLHREIMYGPDDFEAWVTQLDELDYWEEECCGGAVADYDRKKLIWCGEGQSLQVPRINAVYNRLLQAAWPGFEVTYAHQGMKDLSEALGAEDGGEWYGEERPESVREAARIYEDDELDEEDEDDEEYQRFDKDDIRAWVTIVEAEGAIRHRHLSQLSEDLLTSSSESFQFLLDLPADEVPPEGVVAEGMWLDQANKSIGVWGGHSLHTRLPDIQSAWQDWSVQWAERGYEQQCGVAGPAGVPMKDEEALAKVLPSILTTKRFDMSTVLGAIGGGLKKTAMKATGCLLVVICLPLVIFGLVSGNWTAVLISIAVTCAIVITAFKVIEYKVKKSFNNKMPMGGNAEDAPPAAGPLDELQRRQRIDQLLAEAGLPALAKVEPYFPEEDEFDVLG